MSRYFLRIAIAILCFSIGLFGVWASGYWKSFEDFVIDNLSEPMPSMPKGCPRPTPLPHDYSIQKKAVYIQVLKELAYKNTSAQVLLLTATPDNTKSSHISEHKSHDDDAKGCSHKIIEKMPQAKEETLKDYFFQNYNKFQMSYLSEMIALPVFSETDCCEQFLVRTSTFTYVDWGKLDQVFPNGYITLSNVGFNSLLTQAFIYATYRCGTNCGIGRYYLLTKRDGGWVIEKQITVWLV